MKPNAIKIIAGLFVLLGLGAFVQSREKSTAKDLKKVKQRLTRPLTDDELKLALSGMRLRHEPPSENSRLVDLGSKLFFDAGFSDNGQISCATCHQPDRSFTDGKQTAEGLAKTAMNAPTLINAYAGQWFFWNGRADSLAAQALGPVENPKEHGFSRTRVALKIARDYQMPYEELFGALPKDLLQKLPKDGLPPPASKPVHVSNEVAAYALATLASPEFQKKVLREAQAQGQQPIEVLKTHSSGSLEKSTAFDELTADQKDAINKIFANFGRAIAAFERTIQTGDSPFDHFADQVATGKSPDDALVEGFQAQELRGLRLFTGRGNCTLCHQGSHFSDQQFHNIGMMALSADSVDLGRSQGMLVAKASEFNCLGSYLKPDSPSEACRELEFLETESAEAVGSYKTPTLRNLKDTGPYGHDGRFPNLNSILQHYNHLGVPTSVGHTEESLQPLGFSADELKDLEAFLMSLGSSVNYYRGN